MTRLNDIKRKIKDDLKEFKTAKIILTEGELTSIEQNELEKDYNITRIEGHYGYYIFSKKAVI